jgi:signal transduction histidine kinase
MSASGPLAKKRRTACAALRLLAAVLALASCTEPLPEATGVKRFTAALRLADPATQPPPPGDRRYRLVALPEFWRVERRLDATNVWYRFRLDLSEAPAQRWAVYLPRVGLNAAVYVNGVAVGDGGRMEDPVARTWNRPLLFALPPGVLHEGENVVDVRLRMILTSLGMLFPVEVGPDEALRPRYAAEYFVRVTLVQLLSALMLGSALLVGSAYFFARDQAAFRWYALGAGFWLLNIADQYAGDISIPTRLWQWGVHSGLLGAMICFIVAMHRHFNLHRPRAERFLIGLWCVVATGFALLPDASFARLSAPSAIVSFGLVFYIGLGLIRHGLSRGAAPVQRWAVPLGLLILLVVVHDVLLPSRIESLPLRNLILHSYLVPIGVVLAAGALVARHAQVLGEARALNRDLEQRVEEKRGELERNYQRLRQLESERAVSAERERLIREMHDGVGGQLAGALALVESGRATSSSIAASLRESLDDVRLLCDSLDLGEGDLGVFLGAIRARLERRVREHGVRFVWEMSDLPRLAGLGPDGSLEILRILQEALTNVLRHASAAEVRVSGAARRAPDGRDGVELSVCDDGTGFDAESEARSEAEPSGGRDGTRSGRGLAHMRKRAEALGGSLEVAREAVGTRVRLWLPLAASLPPAGAAQEIEG